MNEKIKEFVRDHVKLKTGEIVECYIGSIGPEGKTVVTLNGKVIKVEYTDENRFLEI